MKSSCSRSGQIILSLAAIGVAGAVAVAIIPKIRGKLKNKNCSTKPDLSIVKPTSVPSEESEASDSVSSESIPPELDLNVFPHLILNSETKKFHKWDCRYAFACTGDKYKESYLSKEELIKQGYSPCKNCNP